MNEAGVAPAAGRAFDNERETHGRTLPIPEFVRRSLDGAWRDVHELQGAAEALGVALHGSWQLLLAMSTDGPAVDALEAFAVEVAPTSPYLLAGPVRMLPSLHVPAVLLADDGDHLSQILEKATELAHVHGLLLAISHPVSMWSLPLTYRRETDTIACALAAANPSGVVRAEESDFFRLMQNLPKSVRIEYVQSVLGPVLDLGPKKRAESLATLEAYLRRQGNLDETAAEFGIHRNSLRHRVNRLQELLEADLDSGLDQFRVMVALTLRRLDQEESAQMDGGRARS